MGLLLTILPELEGLEPLGRSEHHHLDALSHTLLAVEKVSRAMEWVTLKSRDMILGPEAQLSLCYAALFHDIGKQDTYSRDEQGRVHFYHHESFSCEAAERIMERLRFSNLTRHQVLRLIQNHMRILNLSEETREAALKRLVHQMGDDTPLLVHLTLADKEASRGILASPRDEEVENHCLDILELYKQKEIVHPPPLIRGADVMALGFSPGPKVGEILETVRQRQVEGALTTREEALRFLEENYSPESGGIDE